MCLAPAVRFFGRRLPENAPSAGAISYRCSAGLLSLPAAASTTSAATAGVSADIDALLGHLLAPGVRADGGGVRVIYLDIGLDFAVTVALANMLGVRLLLAVALVEIAIDPTLSINVVGAVPTVVRGREREVCSLGASVWLTHGEQAFRSGRLSGINTHSKCVRVY
jgi:hypothetical protein